MHLIKILPWLPITFRKMCPNSSACHNLTPKWSSHSSQAGVPSWPCWALIPKLAQIYPRVQGTAFYSLPILISPTAQNFNSHLTSAFFKDSNADSLAFSLDSHSLGESVFLFFF